MQLVKVNSWFFEQIGYSRIRFGIGCPTLSYTLTSDKIFWNFKLICW